MTTIKPTIWKVYEDGSIEFDGYYIHHSELTSFAKFKWFVEHLDRKTWFTNNIVNDRLVDEDFIVACAKSFKLRNLDINPFSLWYAPELAEQFNKAVEVYA